jgi:valyl-tRNA synthetase
LTAQDEQAFEQLWRRLGLSVDWSTTYTTIGRRAQRISQRMFLNAFARQDAYQAKAPTLWDVTLRTAVAQAELEDRESSGVCCRLRFGELEIDTTRPELLPACVALVAHPDDQRYANVVGTVVRTPLFAVEVPILTHSLADPAKGTGLAMVCTFGDMTDVIWWRELRLPIRSIVQRDGRIQADPPQGVADSPAWAALAGRTTTQARGAVLELLGESGDLLATQSITHSVKFYEKGDRPLEIVASRQWFIRVLDRQDALLARGKELRWVPEHMHSRYEHWVRGLNSDWLVSRQRFFGVPIPLWYPVNQDGQTEYDHPIVPSATRLPIDPLADTPDGYDPSQRGKPGGFAGDPDVMDTWGTSSLTPQIAGGWEDDPELFDLVFPMDLRPQAHEIIRTWLFYTVVRAQMEHNLLPWSTTVISGWIVDPDRKKMSKSKGNVVTPMNLLERYGSDAVRYWACRARPGTDTAFDEGQVRVGRRLAIKILHASRFVLIQTGPAGAVTEPLDRSMLMHLRSLVSTATTALEAYDHARALEQTEAFFWSFCDDYVELVKERAYGSVTEAGAASANRALRLALSVILRLFAPFMPFVSEEVWSWWQDSSIHRAVWPSIDPALDAVAPEDPEVYTVAAEVLGQIRRAKSRAQVSMRAPVSRAVVRDTPSRLRALDGARADLRCAGRIDVLDLVEAGRCAVEVELFDPTGQTS